MIHLSAILLGLVAGLRPTTVPTAAAWAARLGGTRLGGWTWILGLTYVWFWTICAAAEILLDKIPAMPSRLSPAQFAARLVMGAVAGAVIEPDGRRPWLGASLGAGGALAGTVGGARARAWVVRLLGRDLPGAIFEDILAVGVAAAVVASRI